MIKSLLQSKIKYYSSILISNSQLTLKSALSSISFNDNKNNIIFPYCIIINNSNYNKKLNIFSCNRSFSGLSSNIIEGNDVSSPAMVKTKLRIKHVLSMKGEHTCTINESATIEEAISHLARGKLSSSLALDSKGEVTGIFTARDIIRHLHIQPNKFLALQSRINHVMTKKQKLVYCSPEDSVDKCKKIMFQLKIRNIPVIENGEILGIITNKDLENCSFSITETGGKKGFIDNINRKGLPDGTKLKKHDEINTSTHLYSQASRLNIEVGSFALPHPYKKHDGVAANRRGYGAHALSEDMSLCEDAHFTIRLKGDRVDTSQVYMCLADGVGSWRQYGVDPRAFSHKLIQNCKDTIESDSLQRDLIGSFSLIGNEALHPIDIIMDAWHMTTQEKINGSSTICVATLDNKLNQLSYSNLGDGGLLIVRHIDTETAGYMRDRRVNPSSNNNSLKIIYLSQQQLRSFNLPYQLGYSNIDEHPGSFEHPSDADTASIPVIPGDLIILATDGLFDNVELDEILDEINTWEKTWFANEDNSDRIYLELPSDKGEPALNKLAENLVRKARELSIDKNRDSPFALLAKENDIMWGGGMPDDTTVIVARVVKVDTDTSE